MWRNLKRKTLKPIHMYIYIYIYIFFLHRGLRGLMGPRDASQGRPLIRLGPRLGLGWGIPLSIPVNSGAPLRFLGICKGFWDFACSFGEERSYSFLNSESFGVTSNRKP